jgi:hypothetical protein
MFTRNLMGIENARRIIGRRSLYRHFPCDTDKDSILRDGRINFVRPGSDAALKVYKPTLEAGARKRLDRPRTANATFAVNHGFSSFVDFARAVYDLAERD